MSAILWPMSGIEALFAGPWVPEAFVTVEEPRAIRRGWVFGRRAK